MISRRPKTFTLVVFYGVEWQRLLVLRWQWKTTNILHWVVARMKTVYTQWVLLLLTVVGWVVPQFRCWVHWMFRLLMQMIPPNLIQKQNQCVLMFVPCWSTPNLLWTMCFLLHSRKLEQIDLSLLTQMFPLRDKHLGLRLFLKMAMLWSINLRCRQFLHQISVPMLTLVHWVWWECWILKPHLSTNSTLKPAMIVKAVVLQSVVSWLWKWRMSTNHPALCTHGEI